jgi:S1-C subfamily serine protease
MLTWLLQKFRTPICVAVLSITVVSAALSQSSETLELNTLLMESTCRIQGRAAAGASTGTGFIMVVPFPDKPERGSMVMITAAHVLNAVVGDSVDLTMRRKLATGWQSTPVTVPIRSNGRPTWVQHPRADVAALYVSMPEELKPKLGVPTTLLIDDKQLAELEIHPGDELNVLGYPLGFGNIGDFPVLRSGKIASYPLVPTSENPFFLLDFRVFQGNSGGPVYFVQSNRNFGGITHIGTIQFVMGLVSEEVDVTQQFQGLYENRSQRYSLELAKIIPAAYIAETIRLLPPVNPGH